MASFDLAAILKDAGAQMGTEGEERLEYLNIYRINGDANNFYQMSGIDELVANIELIGLQQPIRVRPDPKHEGRYIVVSGHRRLTAFRRLAEEENGEKWEKIPAIVEACAENEDLQELRLIYANADTRKISDFELRQQAERVEMLLYKLKEQGMEFPGRMRDHVAEACKISKSKLGRLKQIKDNLAPDISKAYYETGELKEATALALSRLPADVQRTIINHATAKTRNNIKYLYEGLVNMQGEDLMRWRETSCPECKSGHCENSVQLLGKLYSNGYRGYFHCQAGCCLDCPDLASCSRSCKAMEARKQAARAKLKAEKAEAKAADEKAQAEKEAAAKASPEVDLLSKLWQRMGSACEAAGVEHTDLANSVKIYGVPHNCGQWMLGDRTDLDASCQGPFGYYVSLNGIRKIVEIADKLGVTTDYLLGRGDK
jgi:ParB family transcriptional regulator, chromosome partitioning protein